MHLITLTEPVNLGKTLGVLGEGQWLMHDLNAFEIAQKAPRGAAKISQYTVPPQPSGEWMDIPDEDVRAKRPVLVMRSGAWGDLLLLTPALAALSETNAGRANDISCFPQHNVIFQGNKSVLGCQGYPLRISVNGPLQSAINLNQYSRVISLENTMECDHTQHATDVFAKALGLTTPLADYRPIYHVTDAEKEATAKHVFKGRPTIAIQLKASVANRDYPLSLWQDVIAKLERRGWGIVLLGRKGQYPPMPPQAQSPFIRDLSQLDLTFRESAAVLSQCQAFAGVDSAWAHMCHALDIPAVVLFAAFDWKTRTSKAPKTIALTGVGECAPCNWHIHAGREFPPNKPCSVRLMCTVLAGITPERIVAKIALLKP